MKLDTTRLPALVWLAGDGLRQNVVEIASIANDFCYNSNNVYLYHIIAIENISYRIIYKDTLTDLLPEEFI